VSRFLNGDEAIRPEIQNASLGFEKLAPDPSISSRLKPTEGFPR